MSQQRPKNVWEQNEEPKAGFWLNMGAAAGGVVAGSIAFAIVQVLLGFFLGGRLVGLLQSVPWVLLCLGGVWLLTREERKISPWVYVLSGIVAFALSISGIIR